MVLGLEGRTAGRILRPFIVTRANGMTDVPAGRYRHYKGKEYTVIGVARHSETEEELVVYRQEYGDRSLWVRPKAMFLETVEVNGETVSRFKWLGPELPVACPTSSAPPAARSTPRASNRLTLALSARNPASTSR